MINKVNNTSPSQVEPDPTQGESAAPHFSEAFDLTVSIPPIEITMVNASTLSDYEHYMFVSSIVFAAFVGAFSLAVTLEGKSFGPWYFLAIVLLIVFGLFFKQTLSKGDSIKKKSRKIRYKASKVIDDEGSKKNNLNE